MAEIRAFPATVRSAGENEEKRVAGRGIVYDEWTELWPGYKERICKGAVQRADNVKSFFNHDPGKVLSTLESDPALELKESDEGLEYDSPIPPTSYGKDLEINLERGNVKGSSFSFDIPAEGDSWREDENGVVWRDIKKLTLYEIGPVTDPAYVQTTAQARSKEAVKEWRKQQVPVGRLLRERRQKLVNSLLD